MAERDAARCVEKPGVHGITGAKTQRCLPVALQGQVAGISSKVKIGVAVYVGVVEIAFDAVHERSGLPVVAGMDAAQEAFDIELVSRNGFKLAQIVVFLAPDIAGMQADIAAGPDEDRRLDNDVFDNGIGGKRVAAHAAKKCSGEKYLSHSALRIFSPRPLRIK